MDDLAVPKEYARPDLESIIGRDYGRGHTEDRVGPHIDPSISHPRRAIAIRLAQGTSSQIQASRAIATAAAVSSGDIVVNPGLKSGRNVQRRLPALQGEVAGADGALCGR